MRHKVSILVFTLIGVTSAFGQADRYKSFLTACPAGAEQARCVLQGASTRDAGSAKAAARQVELPPIPGPFQEEVQLKIYHGSNAVIGKLEVPDGMQLTVESISANATVPTGQMGRISISTSVRGSSATHYVPLAKQDSEGASDWLLGSQMMRVYGDGGAALILITRSQAAGDATFTVVVSGRLDYPQ